jgi:hypothetical protein
MNSIKNTIIYYCCILLPLPFTFYLWNHSLINPTWFFILIFTYGLVFRPILDTLRLVNKRVIRRKYFWKTFFMWGRTVTYFKELYWI